MRVEIVIPLYLFAFVSAMLGVALIVVSGQNLILHVRRKRSYQEQTTATITDIQQHGNGRSSVWTITCSSRIDGEYVRYQKQVAGKRPGCVRGQTVSLFYDSITHKEWLPAIDVVPSLDAVWLLAGAALVIAGSGIVVICMVWPL